MKFLERPSRGLAAGPLLAICCIDLLERWVVTRATLGVLILIAASFTVTAQNPPCWLCSQAHAVDKSPNAIQLPIPYLNPPDLFKEIPYFFQDTNTVWSSFFPYDGSAGALLDLAVSGVEVIGEIENVRGIKAVAPIVDITIDFAKLFGGNAVDAVAGFGEVGLGALGIESGPIGWLAFTDAAVSANLITRGIVSDEQIHAIHQFEFKQALNVANIATSEAFPAEVPTIAIAMQESKNIGDLLKKARQSEAAVQEEINQLTEKLAKTEREINQKASAPAEVHIPVVDCGSEIDYLAHIMSSKCMCSPMPNSNGPPVIPMDLVISGSVGQCLKDYCGVSLPPCALPK